MSHDHYSDRARDIHRGIEPIAEAIADLTAILEPPQDRVGLPELVTAVQMLADETRGIRCLLVRVLNEMERRGDEC